MAHGGIQRLPGAQVRSRLTHDGPGGTPAVVPGAAPPRPRLGRGRRIMIQGQLRNPIFGDILIGNKSAFN